MPGVGSSTYDRLGLPTTSTESSAYSDAVMGSEVATRGGRSDPSERPEVTASKLDRVPKLWSWFGVALIAALFSALALAVIDNDAALGHDESVYALRTESFVGGETPPPEWRDYRAPGLPWLMQFTLSETQSEFSMRVLVVGFGAGVVLLTGGIALMLFDTRVAVLASLGVAMTPLFLRASTQVWPDVPGAFASLAAIAMFLAATSGNKVRWWIVFVAPLAFWATTLRYGAPIPIAIALVVISLARWHTILRSWPLITATAIGTLAAVALVLLAPAVTGSTGSPLDAFLSFRNQKGLPLYQGLVDYVKASPVMFAGPHGLLLGIGLTGLAVDRRSRADAAVRLTLSIAVLTTLGIALNVSGEPRYLSVVVPFAWMLAAVGIVSLAGELGSPQRWAVVAVVAVFLTVTALEDSRVVVPTTADNLIRSAADAIDYASIDGACGVITSYEPQVRWYSDCSTSAFAADSVDTKPSGFDAGWPIYLLWLPDGKRQPDPSIMAGYLAAAKGTVFAKGDPTMSRGYVEVWEIVGEQ